MKKISLLGENTNLFSKPWFSNESNGLLLLLFYQARAFLSARHLIKT